jgi:hypothetical protein
MDMYENRRIAESQAVLNTLTEHDLPQRKELPFQPRDGAMCTDESRARNVRNCRPGHRVRHVYNRKQGVFGQPTDERERQ